VLVMQLMLTHLEVVIDDARRMQRARQARGYEPRWLGHCEACLRCLNTCPRRAIEYGDSTVGRDRYLNPRIALRELTGR